MTDHVTTEPVLIGLAGLCVTLLLGLITTVWKLSSLATTLTLRVGVLDSAIAEMKALFSDVKEIPLIKQRVSQLENTVQHLASVRPRSMSHHDPEETG